MHIINVGFKLFKLVLALILLAFFHLLETFMIVIYLIVETPLSWVLNKIEKVIKYLMKNV
jgi:hypothetical protein